MIDWQSEEVIEFCGFLFTRMSVLVLGLYSWYIVITFHAVEWNLFTQRLKVSSVIVSYLVGRYCLLTTLLMLVAMNQMGQLMSVICDSSGSKAVVALAILGNMSLVSASTNLQIRAATLWKHNLSVCTLLVVFCLAHWAFCIELGITGFGIIWDHELEECTVDFGRAHRELMAFYLYTVVWDTVILVLTVLALYKQHDARHSPLWSALLTQGTGYLIITCLTNIPMTVMAWLELNYILVVFFILPGNTISVMASSAAVTSLLKIIERAHLPDPQNHPIHAVTPVRERIRKDRTVNFLTTNIEISSTALRNSAEIQESRFDHDVELGMSELEAEVADENNTHSGSLGDPRTSVSPC